jgi:signal transduction histidine kinase
MERTDVTTSILAENRLLHRAIETITSSLELNQVLAATVDLVTEATGGDMCLLHLWDSDEECLVLRAASGPLLNQVGRIKLALGEGVSGWVAEHREVVVIPEDKWGDPRYKYLPELKGELFTSMLSVPVISRSDTLIGVFNMHSRQRRDFSGRDIEFLSLIASLVADAIENADLFRALAKKEAALEDLVRRTIEVQEEERRRVATEIHDGVTQQLVSIWYHLQACGQSLRQDPDRAEGELGKARELVDAAFTEARSAIYELRPSMLDDLGLVPSVRALVLRQLEGEAEVELDVDEDLYILPHHEVAVYRVAQEAITNIRKHAGAGRVVLSLRDDGSNVVLRVQDDGRGFDTSTPRGSSPATAFGLTGVAERAALIGGALTIRSTPGAGTILELRIPKQAAEVTP